jgi:hypothetical protein
MIKVIFIPIPELSDSEVSVHYFDLPEHCEFLDRGEENGKKGMLFLVSENESTVYEKRQFVVYKTNTAIDIAYQYDYVCSFDNNNVFEIVGETSVEDFTSGISHVKPSFSFEEYDDEYE